MSNIRTYRVNHAMQMISIPLHSTTNSYHLGNTDEVVDAKGVVQQVTNYYPFGAPYADASATLNPSLQAYKYNGKEFELMHGLNTYDHGARQNDPVLCRWDRMDPLSEKYYSTSPYAYCVNNPVRFIDPDGMEIDTSNMNEEEMRMLFILYFLTYSLIGYAKDFDNKLDSITNLCYYKEYTLSLKTYILKDSVVTNDLLWQKPTVIKQEISIYNKKKLIKKIKISNIQIHIHTKDNAELEISQIPIIDVSFVKGTEEYLYLYGALNCNGIGCPEYLGIYDLSGNKCVEYISTCHDNKYKLFEEFVSKHKIDLDNCISQTSIINTLVW